MSDDSEISGQPRSMVALRGLGSAEANAIGLRTNYYTRNREDANPPKERRRPDSCLT